MAGPARAYIGTFCAMTAGAEIDSAAVPAPALGRHRAAGPTTREPRT
jgi:hypothetical protein